MTTQDDRLRENRGPASALAPRLERSRVIVADSDPVARSATHSDLQNADDVVVIAEASDGVETHELAVYYRPDVVLCAERLHQLSGVEAMRRTRRLAPEVAFIFLVTEPCSRDEQWAYLRAGAGGVLGKSTCPTALIHAVTAVAAGEAAVSDELKVDLVRRLRTMPGAGEGTRPILSCLTAREWEVLDLLGAGHATAAIAARLDVVEDTVISHLKHTARKLGTHNRADLIAEARRLCRYERRVVA